MESRSINVQNDAYISLTLLFSIYLRNHFQRQSLEVVFQVKNVAVQGIHQLTFRLKKEKT